MGWGVARDNVSGILKYVTIVFGPTFAIYGAPLGGSPRYLWIGLAVLTWILGGWIWRNRDAIEEFQSTVQYSLRATSLPAPPSTPVRRAGPAPAKRGQLVAWYRVPAGRMPIVAGLASLVYLSAVAPWLSMYAGAAGTVIVACVGYLLSCAIGDRFSDPGDPRGLLGRL